VLEANYSTFVKEMIEIDPIYLQKIAAFPTRYQTKN